MSDPPEAKPGGRPRPRLIERLGRFRRGGRGPLSQRVLGVPWLFAIAYASVGFSVYFSLGVVADRGLGLTPVLFLIAGLLFVLATLTYVEGGAMFRDRGGSSSLGRHAFNELVSFVAGWAILIDYVIVIALAAVSTPHYLSPLFGSLGSGAGEVLTAIGVIVLAGVVGVLGLTGQRRQRALVGLAIADLALQLLVIGVGAAVVLEPGLLTAQLDLFTSPTLEGAIYALVIATVALAGIEAASDIAPELDFRPRELGRVVGVGALLLPLIYAGIAAIALMAVPVRDTAGGPATALGGEFIESPVLGVVQSFEPAWLAGAMEAAVVAVAPLVLVVAASTAMGGLSRHAYALATNRQIPSWLGRLGSERRTPYVAIAIAAAISAVLVIPGDIELLVGVYAFGATLAITIAHVAVVRLRVSQPERPRPFRIPFNVSVGGHSIPLPAVLGAVLMGLAWVSVVAFHEGARYVGGGWMAFGLVAYVIYRRLVERTSLTERVTVPERALAKEVRGREHGDILVPVFGTKLDEDIVSTAGRLAAAADEPGEAPPALEVVYVIDLPLTVPLDSRPAAERVEAANAALARAHEIAEEYDTVEVNESVVRARDIGAGIVKTARERGVELIVMGGEPPTQVRGGAILGGLGGSRPAEIGPVTEYVLRRAPCPVLVTAPERQ